MIPQSGEEFWLPARTNPLQTDALTQPLSVDSTPTVVRNYFDFVFQSEQSGEQFPVDFDIVWPLAYSRKDVAKRALVTDFFEGEDYEIPLSISAEREIKPFQAQQEAEKIFLSTKCMEFFIARKVRPIFEVYRQCRQHLQTQARLTPPAPRPSITTNALLPVIARYIDTRGAYKGRPMELWLEIRDFLGAFGREQVGYPTTPNRFAEQLYAMTPQLCALGVEVRRLPRQGSGARVAVFRPTEPLPAPDAYSFGQLVRIVEDQGREIRRLKGDFN